jgi:hypothetical protein
MPLYWAHAEYVSLIRSRHDDVYFDRIELVYQRYAKTEKGSKMEMWTFSHQPQRIGKGKRLRIITEEAAKTQPKLAWDEARPASRAAWQRFQEQAPNGSRAA